MKQDISSNKSTSIPEKKPNGIKRIWLATQYSYRGLIATAQHEEAFRQELLLLLCAFLLMPLFATSWFHAVALIGSVIMILIVELLNSAIEAIVDRVGLEFHELSGRAKDMGSAAVFLSITLAGMIWLVSIIQWFLHH
ncbi:diacylglycerol kinase [Reinekea marina]|uniref:Diacylglycerol kinase n=1 Tax=Reinekea marina TaxID=1310421 RepID=A0ABV7WM40_9GAMM|nr:diacylglycerol kinase [Reinekea marina]MBU2862380.1 diacylglycerol kinase [Reinekea forsetii]MDN3649926.1 diacylglycerol kinase [Reinekea marina]